MGNKCYFCGEDTEHCVLVENGVPFCHPSHFDNPGYVPVCEDWYMDAPMSKCCRRVRDRALRDAQNLLRSVWTDRVASLLKGRAWTVYQPYTTIPATRDLPVVMEIPPTGLGRFPRLPNGCGVAKIWRVPEGYVSYFAGTYTMWASAATCDAYRRQYQSR